MGATTGSIYENTYAWCAAQLGECGCIDRVNYDYYQDGRTLAPKRALSKDMFDNWGVLVGSEKPQFYVGAPYLKVLRGDPECQLLTQWS